MVIAERTHPWLLEKAEKEKKPHNREVCNLRSGRKERKKEEKVTEY